jgi:hypothetical protein
MRLVELEWSPLWHLGFLLPHKFPISILSVDAKSDMHSIPRQEVEARLKEELHVDRLDESGKTNTLFVRP